MHPRQIRLSEEFLALNSAMVDYLNAVETYQATCDLYREQNKNHGNFVRYSLEQERDLEKIYQTKVVKTNEALVKAVSLYLYDSSGDSQ